MHSDFSVTLSLAEEFLDIIKSGINIRIDKVINKV